MTPVSEYVNELTVDDRATKYVSQDFTGVTLIRGEDAGEPLLEERHKRVTDQSVEALVERYIRMRDTKDRLKKAYAKKIAPLEDAMGQIEGLLLRMFEDTGIDSAKCGSGTAYKSRRCSATVADWDAALRHIIAKQAWSMLEKRVSKDAVEAYKEEYGDLPPGVNWREELVVNVRRS